MIKPKKIFVFVFLFMIILLFFIPNVFSNNNKVGILEEISNSKNILIKTINGDKYISIIDKLLISIKEINDINKIQKINLKTEEYIKSLSANNDLKSKKIILILGYLKSNIDILVYDIYKNYTKISEYEEKINIPKYDLNNSAHVLITLENGKWNKDILNNYDYQHFYIKPGDYSGLGLMKLTATGSDIKKRTISLYNGNNKHPASLDVSEQANVYFEFKGGDYWIVDRLSTLNRTKERDEYWFNNKAEHNIINRLYLYNYHYGIIILNGSNFNTIQNSYIDTMTYSGILSDNVGIALSGGGELPIITEGTKIINNEIRNANDGIQLVVHKESVDFPGTIIDNNRIWMDEDIYYDGLGNKDPLGNYMIGENAIDIKTGSDNPDKPVIITNNIMWGYQDGDTFVPGGFSRGVGTAFVNHYECKNIKINNNIIFDSGRGVTWTNGYGADGYIGNHEFKNNILYHLSYNNPDNSNVYSNFFYDINNIKVENNSFIDSIPNKKGSHASFRLYRNKDSTIKNNLFINTFNINNTKSPDTIIDNNWFYDSSEILTGNNEYHYELSSDANMLDYTFIYSIFTNDFKVKTLKSAIVSEISPHFGLAGSNIR